MRERSIPRPFWPPWLRDFGMAPSRFGVEALLPREVIAGRLENVGYQHIPIEAAAISKRGRRAVEQRGGHEHRSVRGRSGCGKGLRSRDGALLRGSKGASRFQGEPERALSRLPFAFQSLMEQSLEIGLVRQSSPLRNLLRRFNIGDRQPNSRGSGSPADYG